MTLLGLGVREEAVQLSTGIKKTEIWRPLTVS